MSRARVVMDLSTSVAWTRPPVGIVRTEQKIAGFLRRQTEFAHAFCRYDKQAGVHVPMSEAEVDVVLSPSYSVRLSAVAEAPASDGDQAAGATPARDVPKRKRMRALLKRLAFRIAARLPVDLQPEGHEVLRATRELAYRYWHLAKSSRRGSGAPLSFALHEPKTKRDDDAFAFLRDDLYVSAGLDWDYNSLSRLYREKRLHGFRALLFCYDTVPIDYPQLTVFDGRQHFARYMVDLAHTADIVMSISETSRSDFVRFMHAVDGPDRDVRVAHLGTDIGAPPAEAPVEYVELLNEPFILCVGTIEARKNHELLYNVWDRWVARAGDAAPILVIVGMPGWGVNDLLHRIRVNPNVGGKIRILDHVSDESLAWLYRACEFTVYPSLYEGWGLPVSESLAVGKPCICSNAPAVQEAAAGLATCIDPIDTLAWLAAITALHGNARERDLQTARIRAQYRVPTWDEHGTAMLAAFREMLA
jgi:glycosyltransferase involved in cell wall biosynthesis